MLPFLFFSGSSAAAASSSSAHTDYAAYTKGYQDAQNGRSFEPIADVYPEEAGSSSKSSGGWGIGKHVSRRNILGTPTPCPAGGNSCISTPCSKSHCMTSTCPYCAANEE